MSKENDKLNLTIIQPEYFEPQFWKPSYRQGDAPPKIVFIKNIPPLMTKKEFAKIETPVKISKGVTQAIMVFSILALLFMDGGSFQFFSSLRSL